MIGKSVLILVIIVDEMRLRFDNKGNLMEIRRHRDLIEMP